METTESLRVLPLFQVLDDAAVAEISRLAQRRSYAPGQLIGLEGEPCTVVYFVARGWVKVYKLSLEGREQVLTRLGPGQSLYLVPAFDGGPNPASAEALTEVILYAFRRDDFLWIVHRHPQVALTALQDLAAKLRHLTALVEDLSLRTVEGRLAKLLLNLAAETDEAPRRMTQQEMAAQLGTVREVVGRILVELEGDGLIRKERHRIVIVDRVGLEGRARL